MASYIPGAGRVRSWWRGEPRPVHEYEVRPLEVDEYYEQKDEDERIFGFVRGGFRSYWDSTLGKQVERVLDKSGQYLLDSIKDPYAPKSVDQFMDLMHSTLWDDLGDELKESIMSSLAYGDRQAELCREFRLKGWPTHSPRFWPRGSCCPNPGNWLRAKALYALLPADATTWRTLRSPFGFFVFCVGCTSYYGASVWLFVLLFFLIDKRDEYQLVNYVLKFKGFQAISALISAAFAASSLYGCAVVEEVSTCHVVGPGLGSGGSWIALALEPVKVLLVWTACLLLWCGYAYGGKKEILALEMVRQDAADGSLDGRRDIKSLRDQDCDLSRDELEVDIDDDDIDDAVQQARKALGAEVGTGGALPYFLLYDVAVLAGVCFFYGGDIIQHGLVPDDPAKLLSAYGHWGTNEGDEVWRFWTTMAFAKLTYGLLAFPFLLFSVPLIGSALKQKCKPTGYDKHGLLCATLSGSQMRQVFLQREEKRAAAKAKRAEAKKAREAGPSGPGETSSMV